MTDRAKVIFASLIVILSHVYALAAQPPTPEKGWRLILEGNTLMSSSAFGEAAKRYEEAYRIFNQNPLEPGRRIAQYNLGVAQERLGNTSRALTHYLQALAIARALHDREGEARTLVALGKAHSALAVRDRVGYENAIKAFEQAAVIFRERGLNAEEGKALLDLAHEYQGAASRAVQPIRGKLTYAVAPTYATDTPEYAKGLRAYRSAVTAFHAAGLATDEASALVKLADAYQDRGDHSVALKAYGDALAIYRVLGLKKTEAATLEKAGRVYSAAHDFEKSIETDLRALTIYSELGLSKPEGPLLRILAREYERANEPAKAELVNHRALEGFQSRGETMAASGTLSDLAKLYHKLRAFDRAEVTYRKALELLRQWTTQSKDPSEGAFRTEFAALERMRLLERIARVYVDNGRHREAIDTYNAALTTARGREGEEVFQFLGLTTQSVI